MQTNNQQQQQPVYAHFDLNGTLCPGDSTKSDEGYADSVELNLCATLAKYTKGKVMDGKFHLAEGSMTYKEFLIQDCKGDKKTREVRTRKILEEFPQLKFQYQL